MFPSKSSPVVASRGIHLHSVPEVPPEQLADRDSETLAEQVPESNINTRDGLRVIIQCLTL